jgi:hypothetical protein
MKPDEMASDMAIPKMADFRHFVDVLGCLGRGKWCPEEDSNLHGVSPAAT